MKIGEIWEVTDMEKKSFSGFVANIILGKVTAVFQKNSKQF